MHQNPDKPGAIRQRAPPKKTLLPNQVEILVRKVRNKAAGTVGTAVLSYDRPSGRYSVSVVG